MDRKIGTVYRSQVKKPEIEEMNKHINGEDPNLYKAYE